MKTPSLRFLALGDSYTIGESVDPADRWPMQLARLLRADGIDIGDPQIIARTGWTTDELSSAIDAANPQAPFQLVTLVIGVNNQYRGRSVEEFRVQFAALLSRSIGFAGNDPRRVVVLSIPDWGVTPFARDRDRTAIAQQIDAFNSVCREECQKKHVAFVDITPISRDDANNPAFVAADGLHPSAKAYEQWAQAAHAAARAALGARP
jgi:lysophospholipase L1-like esterase